jgi:hypothetical protein
MLRRLFDAALSRRSPPAGSPGAHWGLRAVVVVNGALLLERRPGFDAGPACAALDADLLELGPGAGARAAAAAVNRARVDVLVDLWGWAPAGRAAGTLEVLALRPAAASVLLLGTVEGGGGLADWTVRARPGPPHAAHAPELAFSAALQCCCCTEQQQPQRQPKQCTTLASAPQQHRRGVRSSIAGRRHRCRRRR